MADLWMDVDVALSEVPINAVPLVDDTDFKTIEASISVSAPGMALNWNFINCTGAFTQTAVVPTSAGVYDWTNQGGGMYTVEIPASGGGSINNDTEGFGWFTGVITGVLPFKGPTIGFRSSTINDALIDSNTFITASDLGILYEGAISTVNSQTSFDMDTGIAVDDNWIGQTAVVEDISTGDFAVRYVSDVVAASNRLILNAAPLFTVVTSDKIRVYLQQHPTWFLENYGTCKIGDLADPGVNIIQVQGATITGVGTSADPWGP